MKRCHAILFFIGACLARADSFTYDEAGRLTSATAANGEGVAYAYDQAGNLVSATPIAAATRPVLTAQPASATAQLTGAVVFTVNAVAGPGGTAPSFQWQRAGADIAG